MSQPLPRVLAKCHSTRRGDHVTVDDQSLNSAAIHAALHSLGQLPIWVWAVLVLAVVRSIGPYPRRRNRRR